MTRPRYGRSMPAYCRQGGARIDLFMLVPGFFIGIFPFAVRTAALVDSYFCVLINFGRSGTHTVR